MRCPKCGGTMMVLNRNGVGIEQCQMCKGIYLDNGEIEALKQREGFAAVVQASMPNAGNQPPPGPGMTCPKCAGLMRHYNRNSVGIEQCDGCRGIFLDHGELETLKANESPYNRAPGWGAPGAYSNPYPQQRQAAHYQQYGHHQQYGHYQQYGHHQQYGYYRRPKTMFELLIST